MNSVGNDASTDTMTTKNRNFLGIRGRLLIGFSVITLFFLSTIAITIFTLSSTRSYSNKVITNELPSYSTLLDLNNLILQSQLITQNILLLPDEKKLVSLNKIFQSIDNKVMLLEQLSKTWHAEYQQSLTNIKALLIEIKAQQLKVLELANNADKSLALNYLEQDLRPKLYTLIGLLNSTDVDTSASAGILDIFSKRLQIDTQEVIQDLDFAELLEYILSLLGIIISGFIAYFTTRAILRYVNTFRQHSSRISSGDLTRYVRVESNDEMGRLGHDLNEMTKSLAAMVREMTQSSHNMVSTIEEVRRSVEAQSAGASEQASSINEITASLSEIDKSSGQTMEKAKSLGEAADQTRKKGQLGLDAVNQSVLGMKEIREKVELIAQTILDLSNQTQQVGEITSVVNNLAQQSKMLALNASIEAAKAGEAGKGFAVVAVEVKNLAEQSERATTQVQKILEDIRHSTEKAVLVTEEGTKGVDHGTALVEQTGEIIRNLNEVIHETTIATQQIESAVRQESAGIEQITIGMNEINQVTASFVESVNQTTEAMVNLATIAKNLKSYVDTYKI